MSLIDELSKPLSLDDARDYIRDRHSSNKGVPTPMNTTLPSWLEDRDLWTSNSKTLHEGDAMPDLDFKAMLHNSVKAASTQHVTAFHALRNSDISHHSDANSNYNKTHMRNGENKSQQKHWGAVALPLPLHVVTAPAESNQVANGIDSSIRSSSEWKDVRSSLNKSIDDNPTNPAAAHLSQRLLTDAKLFKPLANQWASGVDIEDSLYWIAYATQPSNRQPTSSSSDPPVLPADEDPTTRKYNEQLRQMIAVEAMSLPRRVPRLLEQVKRENERIDRLAAVIQHETFTFLRKERALYDKMVLGEEKSSLQHRAVIRIQAVARGRSARLRTAGMKANRRVLVALHNLLQEINISEGDRQIFPPLAFGSLSQLLQPSKPAAVRSSQSMHSKAAAGSGLSAVNRSKIVLPLQSYDRPVSYAAGMSISQQKYASPMKGGQLTRPSTDYTDYNADSKDQDDGSNMRYNKIFHSAKSLTESISRSNTAPLAAAAASGYFSPMMTGLDIAPSSSRANTYPKPDNSAAKTSLSYGSLVPPIGIAPFSNENTPRVTSSEEILLESVPAGRKIQSTPSNKGSKPGIATSPFSPYNNIDIQQSASAYLPNSDTTTNISTTNIPTNPFSPNRRTLKLLSDNFSASDQLGDLPATFTRGSYNQDAGPMSVSFAPNVSSINERLINVDTNERRVARLDSPPTSAMKGTVDQTTPGSNLSGYLSEFSSPLQDDLIGIGYISSPGHSHSYDNSNHSQSNEHSLSRSLSATFGQVAFAVPKGSPASNMDRITQSRSLMQLMESKDDDDMSEYLDVKLTTGTPLRPMAQLNDTFRIYPSTPSAAESTFQQVKQVMDLVQKRFQTDTCTVRGFISSALVADQRNFDKNASLRLLQSMVMVTGVSPLVQWLQLFRCLPHDEQEDVKKRGGSSSSIIEQSPSASLVLGPGEVSVQDAALLIAELASELQLMDTSAGRQITNEDEREREMMFNLIQTCILFKLLGAGTDSGLLRISELTGLLEDAWILAVPMNGVRISNMLAKLRFSVLQQATRKASRPRKLFDDVVTASGISIKVSRTNNTNNPNPSSSSDDDALTKWYDEDRISAEDVEIIIEKLFINSNSRDDDLKSSSRTTMKSPSPTKSTKKSVYLELAKVLIKMSSWNDFSSFISILDLRNMLCSLCSFRVLQKRLQVWFRAVPSMHSSLLDNLKQFDISHEDGYSTDIFLSAGLQSKIPLSQSELYMLAQLLIRKRTTGARISSGGNNAAMGDQDKSVAYVDVSLLKRVEVGDFLHAALV